MTNTPTRDPLLQPYQLKHLTLRNRLMSTAHEPNYHHDGMPAEKYRLYHVEKAKGGIALTMTAGSAIVSPDSPAAFGNLQVYKDEVVPHMKRLTDECHEHGAAVMIQITHLGRRTNWNHSDWLPVLAASPVREPAHRSFPKEMEDWDIERIIEDYAAAAQRMQAGGMEVADDHALGFHQVHCPAQQCFCLFGAVSVEKISQDHQGEGGVKFMGPEIPGHRRNFFPGPWTGIEFPGRLDRAESRAVHDGRQVEQPVVELRPGRDIEASPREVIVPDRPEKHVACDRFR